jgi:hypothetical protein
MRQFRPRMAGFGNHQSALKPVAQNPAGPGSHRRSGLAYGRDIHGRIDGRTPQGLLYQSIAAHRFNRETPYLEQELFTFKYIN